MKVAFDATATPVGLTGAGYYVMEIVQQLDRADDVELVIITRKNDGTRFEQLAESSRILAVAPDSTPARIVYQTLRLGTLVDSLDVDIFHGPHYQIPMKMRTPSVVTIHDMTLVTHPQVHTRAKRLFFSRVIGRSAEKASGIISVSQHTADDIERVLGAHNIIVAPLGVNTQRFNATAHKTDQELLEHRGITEPYIGFLGVIEPRKSIDVLIGAFSRLASDFPEHRLIIAGGDGWGMHDVRQARASSGVSTRIVMTGRLSDEEVPAFLRHADVFAYPSMYEGFGMPIIEAMACGAPVITTRSSSLSEVAGDAAELVEPRNVSQLEIALRKILSDSQRAQQLTRKGIERSREFTWERCADAHIEAYSSALGV